MKTVQDVVEHLEANGEQEHSALQKQIFEAGGMPDHRMFLQLLKSDKISRRVVVNDDGTRTVHYSAKA